MSGFVVFLVWWRPELLTVYFVVRLERLWGWCWWVVGGGRAFSWEVKQPESEADQPLLYTSKMGDARSCTFTASCFFIASWFIKHRNIFMYSSHLQRAGLVKMALYACVRRYLASNLCPVSGCHNSVGLVPSAYRSLCGDRL